MSYVALDSHPETFSYSRHNDTKMSKKLIQIPKMVFKKVLKKSTASDSISPQTQTPSARSTSSH